MKVLQVNCVYKNGSTGKLTYELHKGLKDMGITSVVCYGRGDKVEETGVYKICGELEAHIYRAYTMLNGLLYSGCFRSTKKLEYLIEREKPDIVHLQCINGYFVNIYRIINWLNKNRIPTVLTLHAEFMHTGTCGYALDCERWKTGCGSCPQFKKETHSLFFDNTHKSWLLMKEAFKGFEHLEVVSVSQWLMKRAKESPILKEKNHSVIFNGVNTDIFHYENSEILRKDYGAEDKKIVFHATPSFTCSPDHIKGGYYVCELAKMMPDIVFLIAGPFTGKPDVPSNVILLGKVINQEKMALYYSSADATILTSKKETFSMVTAESLCCGTPVVGFKAGAPEQISIPEYSSFVEYGDLIELFNTLNNMLARNINKEDICKVAKKKYSLRTMLSNYLKVYDKVRAL